LYVLARPFGDLDRVAAAELLDPDVELSAAVGTVGDEAAIGRPGGSDLQAFVEGEPAETPLDRPWNMGAPFLVGEPACTGQQDDCAARQKKH
jgi:hypothetical protein